MKPGLDFIRSPFPHEDMARIFLAAFPREEKKIRNSQRISRCQSAGDRAGDSMHACMLMLTSLREKMSGFKAWEPLTHGSTTHGHDGHDTLRHEKQAIEDDRQQCQGMRISPRKSRHVWLLILEAALKPPHQDLRWRPPARLGLCATGYRLSSSGRNCFPANYGLWSVGKDG